MNNQEAIKSLRNIIEFWTYKPTEVEACKLAISALEKQIPKKPTDIDRDYNYFECASCGNSIYSTEKLESHKFCLNCGQAIDWRKKNE